MDIKNSKDLKMAYELLYAIIDTFSGQKEIPQYKVDESVRHLKKSIRDYQHETAQKTVHRIVKDNGIDGYVELFEIPNVADPEAWFDANERRTYTPSLFDCTGQSFTKWHKIINRHGKTLCYHSVGFDV